MSVLLEYMKENLMSLVTHQLNLPVKLVTFGDAAFRRKPDDKELAMGMRYIFWWKTEKDQEASAICWSSIRGSRLTWCEARGEPRCASYQMDAIILFCWRVYWQRCRCER
eukprot:3878378-Pyramimonas_sp.AAC.1